MPRPDSRSRHGKRLPFNSNTFQCALQRRRPVHDGKRLPSRMRTTCHKRHMKPVTIKDIAKAANVNQSTVSKALRGLEGLVSPDTAKRIVAIATKMGYRHNAVAASHWIFCVGPQCEREA